MKNEKINNNKTYKENINNNSSNSLSLSDISLANPESNDLDEKDIEKNKKLGHFVLGEKLGQGMFGFVRLATHSLTGEKVAIKILDKEKLIKEKDKFRLKNEIKILKKLRHTNLVQLYGVIDTKLSINLIMEYCEGEELLDFINRKQRLKETEACIIFQQIISGIEYLAKNNITHRDLKPENILINKNNLKIKIVDFGLSNIYKDNQLLKSKCGSLCFAAPEMISGKRYSGLNVDIWSSGVILFSMICGYLPFQEEDSKLLYEKIVKGKYQIPYYVSQNAGDLIHKILKINPNKRYTIEQIRKHKWFKMMENNINITEGLLLDKYVIPIDDDIINILVKEYKFNEEEIKINILKNKHNLITICYYLLLNKKIKEQKKSICDMSSPEFNLYLNDNRNLLENYGYNLDKVCEEKITKTITNQKNLNNNNNKLNNKNIFKTNPNKGEITTKLEKLHEEMDNIKKEMLITSENERNQNQINNSKYKKMILRNLILKKDDNHISKTDKKRNDSKSNDKDISKNKDVNYSHSRILTNTNNIDEHFRNINKNSLKTLSTIANSKYHKKEISTICNGANSTLSNNDKKKKQSMFRLTKDNNNNIINFKLNFNSRCNSKDKRVIINFDKKNSLINSKDYYYHTNNNAFSERKKNNYFSNKKDKPKKTYNSNRRKVSSDLIFTNEVKNKTVSSKLFNSNLINKNNVLSKYKIDTNNINNKNNFSMTIYENESQNIKSIYARKNKNLSDYIVSNIDDYIDSNNDIKEITNKKNKNKITLLIKHKNKKDINDIFFKKQNYNTNQHKEKNNNNIRNEKNNNKKEIKPSMSYKSYLKTKKNSEIKKKIFISTLNINNNNNNAILQRVKRFNKEKPLLKKHFKNVNKNNNNNCNINKTKYIPFDLNSIVIMNKKKDINYNIGIVLDKNNIKYIIQKNKFVCWKNDFVFEFTICPINKDEKIFYLNVINKSTNLNAFKNLMSNIINSLSK